MPALAGASPSDITLGMTRALVAASAALVVGCFNPRIQNGGFSCKATDPSPCPAGFSCVAAKCVASSDGGVAGGSGLSVAQTGVYGGLKLDPMLARAADCPDAVLQPNDGPGAPP